MHDGSWRLQTSWIWIARHSFRSQLLWNMPAYPDSCIWFSIWSSVPVKLKQSKNKPPPVCIIGGRLLECYNSANAHQLYIVQQTSTRHKIEHVYAYTSTFDACCKDPFCKDTCCKDTFSNICHHNYHTVCDVIMRLTSKGTMQLSQKIRIDYFAIS